MALQFGKVVILSEDIGEFFRAPAELRYTSAAAPVQNLERIRQVLHLLAPLVERLRRAGTARRGTRPAATTVDAPQPLEDLLARAAGLASRYARATGGEHALACPQRRRFAR